MIREAMEKLKKKIDLSGTETQEVFDQIMSGRAEPADIEAFLRALVAKGETVEEITAAAKVMREKSVRIKVGGGILLDTCGTGGTGINTFNISTIAAFVIAGCGVKVAKHGNRSASGHTGSADVLEALGVKIDVPPKTTAKCIEDVGIGFLFAPLFHTAMKYASGPRKAIGTRTIFNILGPLSNPAGATHQVIGVCDPKLTETMAGVLRNLGTEKAFVVCGVDSLDEITVTGKTKITELSGADIRTYHVAPEDFGVKTAGPEVLKGSRAKENAEIFLSILKGERSPRRDIVLMNASAGLVCASKAKDFKAGMALAAGSIDSGAALDRLSGLKKITNDQV